MPRRFLIIPAILIDVLITCLLVRSHSLVEAQVGGFALSCAAFWLLNSPTALEPHALIARLSISVLALLVRGGLLFSLAKAGAPLPLAVTLAALLGTGVLSRGEVGRRQWQTLAVSLICVSVLLRMVYAGGIELLPEETYYWNYSQHLALGYLDHPPMIAWLICGGTWLFGNTEFGVRCGALVCGLVTALFVYRTTRAVFGTEAALAALTLASTLPFFFLAGMLSTPDAPLTATWSAALYFLQQALVPARNSAWWRAGTALGLGLISKYTVLMLGAAAALFMLADGKARAWWGRLSPYVAALIAIALFTPVIVWNAENDWASFTFQTSRRLAEAPRFSLHKLIASALILITPTGFAAIVWIFLNRARIGTGELVRSRNFLMLTFTLPLVVFFAFSLRHEVKLDWTGAPWVGALPLLGYGIVAHVGHTDRLLNFTRAAWIPTLTGVMLLAGAGFMYLTLGIPGAGYGAPMELVPVGWRELGRQVGAISADYRREHGEDPVWIGLDRYAIASELSFYGTRYAQSPPRISSTHLFEGVGLMYERWTPAESFRHATLLLISDKERDLTSRFVQAHSGSLGEVRPLPVAVAGRPVATLYYRFAYDYQPVDLPAPIP